MSPARRLRELIVTYRPHPVGTTLDGRTLTEPRTAAAILSPMLEHQADEVFTVLLLDSKHHLIAIHDIARGGLNVVAVEPRAVFRAALLSNAESIIVAHNHPSGDPTPSPDDCNLTARLIAAGTLMGIGVLDHIIVGDKQYCSFRETGRM